MEIILGIPPIDILNTTNEIKHYLKLIMNETPGDNLKQFIKEEVQQENQNSVLQKPLDQVQKFLKWKARNYPESMNAVDQLIIENNNIIDIFQLDPKSGKYTKGMINKYIEHLWQSSVRNEFQLEGHNILPEPKIQPLPIRRGIARKAEVQILSLFYENNLFNSFLYRYKSEIYTSPLCECGREDQTPHHILFRCNLVDNQLRSQAFDKFKLAVGNEMAHIESTINLLNGSRHAAFMDKAAEIILSVKDKLRSDIIL